MTCDPLAQLLFLFLSWSTDAVTDSFKKGFAETERRSCDQGYLAKGSRSSVGAEEAAEAAGSPVLPALWPGPNTGQGATDLPQSIRGGNIRLPQELCNVLPPSCLTLNDRRRSLVKKCREKTLKNWKFKCVSDGKCYFGGGKGPQSRWKVYLYRAHMQHLLWI